VTHIQVNNISASSIVLLIELAIPNASEAPGSLIAVMGTVFLSLSVSSNITSTLLISGQLLRHRRALHRVGLESSVPYTGIIAVIAESGALYSGCGLIYIPLYARNLSSQFAVSALYVSLGVQVKPLTWSSLRRTLLTIYFFGSVDYACHRHHTNSSRYCHRPYLS
jgi:hypothetical protein